MINDTEECRAEFVQWLKDKGLYWRMDSAVVMQRMNDVYWTMKQEGAE